MKKVMIEIVSTTLIAKPSNSSPIIIKTSQKYLFDNVSNYKIILSNKLNSASVDVPLISENVEICYHQKIDNMNTSAKVNSDKSSDGAYPMALIVFCIYLFAILIIGLVSVKNKRI